MILMTFLGSYLSEEIVKSISKIFFMTRTLSKTLCINFHYFFIFIQQMP